MYVKTPKKIQSRTSYDLKTSHTASGTLQSLYKIITLSGPWPIYRKVKFGCLLFELGKTVSKSFNGGGGNLQQMTKLMKS